MLLIPSTAVERIIIALRMLGRASGPSRTIDRQIAVCVGWEGQWVESRKHGGWYWRGGPNDCTSTEENDEHPPHFTESLDAALKLVPEGWFWRCGRTTLFAGWAFVNKTHPDHGDPGRNEFAFHRERDTTPIIALCFAALSARAAK